MNELAAILWPRWTPNERTEQGILAKLREQGVPLNSPDDDLRRAFVNVVCPSVCLRGAQGMRARLLGQRRLL